MIGISVDSRERNRKFAEELGITFPVLSDESKRVSGQYGVLIPLVRMANRYTFVIDRKGVIQEITKGGEAADPEHAQATCSLIGRGKH